MTYQNITNSRTHQFTKSPHHCRCCWLRMHPDIIAEWLSEVPQPSPTRPAAWARQRAAPNSSPPSPPKQQRRVLQPISSNMSPRQLPSQSQTKGAMEPRGQPSATLDTPRAPRASRPSCDDPDSNEGRNREGVDGEGEGEDIFADKLGGAEATPIAKRRLKPQTNNPSVFTQTVALRPRTTSEASRTGSPSRIQSTSTSSLSTTSTGRSRSPVKNVQALSRLETPVYWDTFTTAKACHNRLVKL